MGSKPSCVSPVVTDVGQHLTVSKSNTSCLNLKIPGISKPVRLCHMQIEFGSSSRYIVQHGIVCGNTSMAFFSLTKVGVEYKKGQVLCKHESENFTYNLDERRLHVIGSYLVSEELCVNGSTAMYLINLDKIPLVVSKLQEYDGTFELSHVCISGQVVYSLDGTSTVTRHADTVACSACRCEQTFDLNEQSGLSYKEYESVNTSTDCSALITQVPMSPTHSSGDATADATSAFHSMHGDYPPRRAATTKLQIVRRFLNNNMYFLNLSDGKIGVLNHRHEAEYFDVTGRDELLDYLTPTGLFAPISGLCLPGARSGTGGFILLLWTQHAYYVLRNAGVRSVTGPKLTEFESHDLPSETCAWYFDIESGLLCTTPGPKSYFVRSKGVNVVPNSCGSLA